jgi:hypothetical protein
LLNGKDIVKFTKSCRLCCYGQVEGTQNERSPKEIAAVTMEGARKEEDHVKDGEMWTKILSYKI